MFKCRSTTGSIPSDLVPECGRTPLGATRIPLELSGRQRRLWFLLSDAAAGKSVAPTISRRNTVLSARIRDGCAPQPGVLPATAEGAPLDRCLQPPSGSNGLSAHQARARDVLSPTRFHSDHRSFGRSGRDGMPTRGRSRRPSPKFWPLTFGVFSFSFDGVGRAPSARKL